jgi:hypothetical protein
VYISHVLPVWFLLHILAALADLKMVVGAWVLKESIKETMWREEWLAGTKPYGGRANGSGCVGRSSKEPHTECM